jgi:hypothetical protein
MVMGFEVVLTTGTLSTRTLRPFFPVLVSRDPASRKISGRLRAAASTMLVDLRAWLAAADSHSTDLLTGMRTSVTALGGKVIVRVV